MPSSSEPEATNAIGAAVDAAREALSGGKPYTTVAGSLRERLPDAEDAARAFGDLVGRLYWQDKDLPAVVAFAQEGIRFCLDSADAAEGAGETERALTLRGAAKGLAYNLGSFSWPGWDEPGILVDSAALAIGRDAARLNLRLAQELGRGDLPLSRAHWLLGAHLLAAREAEPAERSFEYAANRAQAAGAPGEELLACAFALLAKRFRTAAADDEADGLLEAVLGCLAGVEQGTGFVQQVETAARVLLPLYGASGVPVIGAAGRPEDSRRTA